MVYSPECPTSENPMLIGLMVDVSGSMMTSIHNHSGNSENRLEGLRNALNDFVAFGTILCEQKHTKLVLPLFRLFAYGFGFGNPLTALLGGNQMPVRDLFDLNDNGDSTISADKLASNWQSYASHIDGMKFEMFGSTPMLQAFHRVHERFHIERKRHPTFNPPILFVLSDGEPTDGSTSQVAAAAEAMKNDGVMIVSCYVTDENITESRKLYSEAMLSWPLGAKMMFDCASAIPQPSQFDRYLREFRWDIEPKARLFTQVNQSEVMSEFLKVILSPLQ